jgi:hypothetical protein
MYFLQEPANSKSKKIHKQTNEGGEKNENEALRSLIYAARNNNNNKAKV